MATNKQLRETEHELNNLRIIVESQKKIIAAFPKIRRDAVTEALRYERESYKIKLENCKDDLNVDLVAFVTATLKLLNN